MTLNQQAFEQLTFSICLFVTDKVLLMTLLGRIKGLLWGYPHFKDPAVWTYKYE